MNLHPEEDRLDTFSSELKKDGSSLFNSMRSTEASDRTEAGPLSRRVLAVIGICFLVVCFAQSPGLIEFDTRLPMIVSPISYFGSVLHLWNQSVFGGTVEQGAGFLVPQGLFYITAYLLHIPAWVAERIWLATLLTVGCWGMVRLAEALKIGNRWARVLAGIAYCVAPIVVTWVSNSGDLLAVVLLPWLLVPLVVGSQGGSTRRAAARSGVAVALMGGANAAVLLAVLPLAVIWLLTREPGPRRRSLALWWMVAVAMACFFWFVSLAFVQHYGYNYLPYTETSITTTTTASAFESLRGASYWINYYSLGGPLIRGSWILVSEPVVIVGTAIVTGLGLAGLCRRVPERLFLVVSLTFGVLFIAAGYAGPLGGLFSHSVQNALQGWLAPFRNVSKFSPDVALPLALGLAWTVSVPRKPKGSSLAALVSIRSGARLMLAMFAIAAVFVAAAPFWQGELYPSGGFSAIPSYWHQVGTFLNEHQGHENALLVPGSSFAYDTWGNPVDEPLQAVASTALEWRNIIPLGSNGYNQMLDAVEQALDDGSSPAGLAEYLSREGIDYVVERNDLNLLASGAPPPAEVHQVLAETPGLTEVASFGPYLPANQVAFGLLPVYDSPTFLRLRAVNIYRVDATTSAVQSFPASDPVVISGDIGSIVSLAGGGVLNGRVSVLSGDPDSEGVFQAAKATWAITDGNQRRVTSFGSIRDNQSYLLGRHQRLPTEVPGVPESFAVVSGAQHQTVSAPIGAASVSASSYGSTPLLSTPSEGPASAFDGIPGTAWIADAANDSIGQWVAITFDKPIRFSTITVEPQAGSLTIDRLKITTDRGTVTRRLAPRHKSYRLSVPPGSTKYLRITITGVSSAPVSPGAIVSGAGIAKVSIPGVSFQPRMLLPDDESATFSSGASRAPVVALSRPIVNPNLSLGLTSSDDPDMGREFNLPKSEAASANGSTDPLPSASLNALVTILNPVPAGGLDVTASSTLGGLPRFRAENLVDDSNLPWIAELGDHAPAIDLSWRGNRPIDSVSLTLSSVAARPTEVAITPAGGKVTVASVPRDGGVIEFPKVVTNSLAIRFVRVKKQALVSPNLALGLQLPVGLSSVSVPGLATTPVPPPNLNKRLTLACGYGPDVQIDGKVIQTSATGTIGDLINLDPLHITMCTPSGGLQLSAGTHMFKALNPFGPFEVTSLILSPTGTAHTTDVAPRTASVRQWGAEDRTINVGAGPASYIVVAQNYNASWHAVMAGHTLRSIRVDGWEQGYLVPAGKAGTVTLTVEANAWYELLLALGGALLVCLLLMAFVPSRRKSSASLGPRSSPNFWLTLGVCSAALIVIAGPLALVLLPFVLIARRWGSVPLAITALVAFVAAGVAAAWHPASLFEPSAGAFGPSAQIASVVAFAAVLSSFAADTWKPRRQRFDPFADDGGEPQTTSAATIMNED